MSYSLDPAFERSAALLSIRNRNFWLRVGNRLDTEELIDPLNKLIIKLCRSVASDHGWPEEELVIQRASLWMNEGSITDADLQALGELLGEVVTVSPEKAVQELVTPVRLAWSQTLSRKVIDRYKNGGFFGSTLLDEMAACDALGGAIAETEIASSELGEDTEEEVTQAPTGRKLLTGYQELDLLWKGGWPLGTLLTWLADAKQCKSMVACYVTACALLQGENAGYLSLELPKAEIHKRVLAALVGVPISDLEDKSTMKDAIHIWKGLKHQGLGRLFIEKFEAGTMDTTGVVSWYKFQEKAHGCRIRFRAVDYGDLVKSTVRSDQDNAYTSGKNVWQALANMAQDRDAPNWVFVPTQSKRPDWKIGQPIPLLTRAGLADSIHKVRITDFLVTATPSPDIRASAGYMIYVDADRFMGTTGTPIGPVPHQMHMARMADMSHIFNLKRQ